MNNQIQLFNFQGHEVRISEINGEPWFAASDVALILGYGNTRQSVSDHCKHRKKLTVRKPDGQNGGPQFLTFIPKSDVFRLIVRSKLPSAERFERWVFDTVLPQIDKTGGYIPAENGDDDLTILSRAVLIAQRTIETQKEKITEMEPKVAFYDTVADCGTFIDLGRASRLLNFEDMGRDNLFRYLRDTGVLISTTTYWNMPYQTYISAGYFSYNESDYTTNDGKTHLSFQPIVSQRGLDFLRKRLLADGYRQRDRNGN